MATIDECMSISDDEKLPLLLPQESSLPTPKLRRGDAVCHKFPNTQGYLLLRIDGRSYDKERTCWRYMCSPQGKELGDKDTQLVVSEDKLVKREYAINDRVRISVNHVGNVPAKVLEVNFVEGEVHYSLQVVGPLIMKGRELES